MLIYLIYGLTVVASALFCWPFLKLATYIFGLRPSWLDTLTASATAWMISGVCGVMAQFGLFGVALALPKSDENTMMLRFLSVMISLAVVIFVVKAYNDIFETSNGFLILVVERILSCVILVPLWFLCVMATDHIKATALREAYEAAAEAERRVAANRAVSRTPSYSGNRTRNNPFAPARPQDLSQLPAADQLSWCCGPRTRCGRAGSCGSGHLDAWPQHCRTARTAGGLQHGGTRNTAGGSTPRQTAGLRSESHCSTDRSGCLWNESAHPRPGAKSGGPSRHRSRL